MDRHCWPHIKWPQDVLGLTQKPLCLSMTGMDTRVEVSSHPTITCKMDISTNDDGPSSSISNWVRHLPRSPFWTEFLFKDALPCYYTGTYRCEERSDYSAYCIWYLTSKFKTQAQPPSRSLRPYCPAVVLQKQILTLFSRVVVHQCYRLFNTKQIKSLQKAWFIYEIRDRVCCALIYSKEL